MRYQTHYSEAAPTREEVDALPGATVLEFGTNWCGLCTGAQGAIRQALEGDGTDTLRHLKVEDGPGRKLGRSFKVKLWPTLIFLRDGREIDRLVRPHGVQEIAERLARIA